MASMSYGAEPQLIVEVVQVACSFTDTSWLPIQHGATESWHTSVSLSRPAPGPSLPPLLHTQDGSTELGWTW